MVPWYQGTSQGPHAPGQCLACRAARIRRGLARNDRAESDRGEPCKLPRPVRDVDGGWLRGITPALGPLQSVIVVGALDGEHDRRQAVHLLVRLDAPATDDDLVGVVAIDLLLAGRVGAEGVRAVALKVERHAREQRL